MLKRALSHGTVAVFWLLHFLPLPVLARLGEGLGLLLYGCGAGSAHGSSRVRKERARGVGTLSNRIR